jgi:hypothetical protein
VNSIDSKRQDRRPASNQALDRPIQLVRSGQYLEIRPALRGLDNYLYTIRHEAVPDEHHGVRVEKQPYPLVWTQEGYGDQRYNQCFAGLEPMVREVLEAEGYDVVLSGERPAELPAPQLDRLNDSDAVDTPVLDLIRRRDRGLIRYASRTVEPATVIAQIALAWPTLKIVAVPTHVSEAVELRRQLQAVLGNVALFTGDHSPARGSRVVVATPNRVGTGAIAIERRDVYIAVNPEHIFTSPYNEVYQAYLDGIKCLWRARVYGLLADDTFLAPWQRSWLMALFGAEQVHVPRHGHHNLLVDVVFSRIYGGERVETDKDDVVLKRRGLWQHRLRNRRVAALFRTLAGKKTKVLARKFPDIAGYLDEPSWDRVGLLVEGVEHGLALARLLPGVPLITGPDVWTEGLSEKAIQIIERGKKGTKKSCAIVTAEGLAQTAPFDVLIRADGGTGLLPLPESHAVVANDNDGRLLLIDCHDMHHTVLAKWSRQRRNAYVAAGWNVAGRAAPSAMDLFVAQRPEVR